MIWVARRDIFKRSVTDSSPYKLIAGKIKLEMKKVIKINLPNFWKNSTVIRPIKAESEFVKKRAMLGINLKLPEKAKKVSEINPAREFGCEKVE